MATAPQFLVLSELNRSKRVKGEFAARQAQQAPTVAEEVVAAAGVPQSGMMGMSEAMAPASVDSGGIGAMMPQTMKWVVVLLERKVVFTRRSI